MQSRVARLRRRRLHLRRHCGFGCGGSNGADKGEGTSSIVEEGADGDMDDRGESTGEGDCHVPCDRRRAYSDNRLRSRALAHSNVMVRSNTQNIYFHFIRIQKTEQNITY